MKKRNYQRNKRLRIFAGPNGSGKTTILEQIDHQFDLGTYINADEIEKVLNQDGEISFNYFGLSSFSKKSFQSKIQKHALYSKAKLEGYSIDLNLEDQIFYISKAGSHSYEAALLADIIRYKLLAENKKITFETVMSHHSKIDFLKKAKKKGYQNYLYYVSTESPLINVERVKQRVELGGHPVAPNKIKSRYKKSLGLLKEAIDQTYRTFIFDNSEKEPKLILEVFRGEDVTYFHEEVPHWVEKYLFK